MANGANGVHLQLREALENYIKSQYFGKSPILLSAMQDKLNQEGEGITITSIVLTTHQLITILVNQLHDGKTLIFALRYYREVTRYS